MEETDPIVWADAQIALHKAQISKLEDYKQIELRRRSGQTAEPAKPLRKLRRVRIRFKTKKIIILKSLRDHGATLVSGVINHLHKAGFKDAAQANTSPLLSLYSAEGLVEREGFFWKITKQGKEYLSSNGGD